MITLDMTRKAAGKPVTDGAFTLENGVLTLQVSLGTYSLTGKTVTAAFSPKLVETGALVVTNGVITIPISPSLVSEGINEIQLNIRTSTTLEQSPIMRWNVLESIFATTSPSVDPDLIGSILADIVQAESDIDDLESGKVDKVTGYALSQNDFTDALETKLTDLPTNSDLTNTLSGKVDKVTGKGLSTEDYTTTEKNKLSGIADNANNYVHPTTHPPSIIAETVDDKFVSDTQINTWNGKQDALGFTAENVANKKTNLTDNSDTYYPSQKAVKTEIDNVYYGRIGNAPNVKPVWAETCQALTGWANPIAGGTTYLSLDSTDYVFGANSIKIIDTGVAQKSGFAFDLTGKALVLQLKVDYLAANQAVNIFLGQTSALSAYKTWNIFTGDAASKWFPYGEWVTVVLPWESSTTTIGTPNRASMDTIRVRTSSGAVGNVIHVQAIGTTPTPSKGTVSITFDDGYVSALLGAQTLSKYGIPSTLYVIPVGVGTTGYLTLDNVKTLQNSYNWDIEAHGNTNYASMTADQLRAEWIATKKWFRSNGFGYCNHMAYPGGINNTLSTNTAREFFVSARTIDRGTMLETYPPAQPYRLRAISGITSAAGGTSIATVQTAIANAAASGEWLILVFHSIVSGTASDSMECSVADLETISASISSSGCDIKTIDEMLS